MTLIKNEDNTGHGPALNQGLRYVYTPYVFLLDSDTRTNKGGFLEEMLELFDNDDSLFAAGWLRMVNPHNGVSFAKQNTNHGLRYIHPYACLMDMGKFWHLKRFTATGAPALELMKDVKRKGFKTYDYPIKDYIWHKEAGTRGLFGGRIKPGVGERPGAYHWRRI